MKRTVIALVGLVVLAAVIAGLMGCKAPSPSPSPAPAPASTTPALKPAPAATPTTAPKPTPTPTPTPAAAPAKVYSLTWSTHSPASELNLAVLAQEWINRVEKRTEGRVKIRLISGGALLSAEESLGGLSKGVCDFATVPPYNFPAELPVSGLLSNITDIKGDAKDVDLIGSSLIAKKLREEFADSYDKEWGRLGIKHLLGAVVSPMAIAMKSPIKVFEDFKGKKIRSYGEYLPKLIAATGAVPVIMGSAEIYTSLSTGLIDGAQTAPTTILSRKIYEAGPYIVVSGPDRQHAPGMLLPTVQYAVNLKTWNSLPTDIQKVMLQVTEEMWVVCAERMSQDEQKTFDDLAKAGAKFSYLPQAEMAKWAANSPDFLALAAESINKAGYSGTKIIARYQELMKDYVAGRLKP